MAEFPDIELPDIVILNIFRFLQFGDLCRVGEVCRKWYHLSRSKKLWKCVDVRDTRLTYHQMEKLVRQLKPSVTHLHVCGALHKTLFLTDVILTEIRHRCPFLQVLIIEGAFIARDISLTDITLHDLPQQLETLSLRRSFFHTDQFFWSSDGSSPGIQRLDVGQCWCIGDNDLPFFSRLSELRELYLDCCEYITSRGVDLLLPRVKQLRVLDLEGTKATGEVVETVSRHCPLLSKLYLGYTATFDRHLDLLTSNPLPRLEELCLIGTHIADQGLDVIARMLPNLKWLAIPSASVTEHCLMKATQRLPTCKITNGSFVGICELKTACEHFMLNS